MCGGQGVEDESVGALYTSDGAGVCSGIFVEGELSEQQDLYEAYPFPDDCIWN